MGIKIAAIFSLSSRQNFERQTFFSFHFGCPSAVITFNPKHTLVQGRVVVCKSIGFEAMVCSVHCRDVERWFFGI